MTSFQLKLVAVLCMTIDHFQNILGQAGLMVWIPDHHTTYELSRVMNDIGRIAFPLFAFMIAEGASKTRSMPRYIGRLALFAVLSEPIYWYVHNIGIVNVQTLSLWEHLAGLNFTNVFVTLALGATAIYLYQQLEKTCQKKKLLWFTPILALILFIGGFVGCDYSMMGIALVVGLYLAKTKKQKSIVIVIWAFLIYAIYSMSNFLFACVSILFIWLYNGKRGMSVKWSFYLYYPAHLAALAYLAYEMQIKAFPQVTFFP